LPISYRPLPTPAARPWLARPWRLLVLSALAALVVALLGPSAALAHPPGTTNGGGFPVHVFVHDEQPSPTFVTKSDARPATDSQ
jgi:hypothetical protein